VSPDWGGPEDSGAAGPALVHKSAEDWNAKYSHMGSWDEESSKAGFLKVSGTVATLVGVVVASGYLFAFARAYRSTRPSHYAVPQRVNPEYRPARGARDAAAAGQGAEPAPAGAGKGAAGPAPGPAVAPWDTSPLTADRVRTRYDRDDMPGTWDRWDEASAEMDFDSSGGRAMSAKEMQQRAARALAAAEHASESAEAAASESLSAAEASAAASKAAADAAAHASRASRAMQAMSEDALLEAERQAKAAFKEAYRAEQEAHRGRMRARELEEKALQQRAQARRQADLNEEVNPLVVASVRARGAWRGGARAVGEAWGAVRRGGAAARGAARAGGGGGGGFRGGEERWGGGGGAGV